MRISLLAPPFHLPETKNERSKTVFRHRSQRTLIAMLKQLLLLILSFAWLASAAPDAQPMRAHERWVWTELIGFDNQQPDLGVGQYLDTAGFVPTAVCLLIGSPDFVLSHAGMEKEVTLAEEYCSRDGHEFNQERNGAPSTRSVGRDFGKRWSRRCMVRVGRR